MNVFCCSLSPWISVIMMVDMENRLSPSDSQVALVWKALSCVCPHHHPSLHWKIYYFLGFFPIRLCLWHLWSFPWLFYATNLLQVVHLTFIAQNWSQYLISQVPVLSPAALNAFFFFFFFEDFCLESCFLFFMSNCKTLYFHYLTSLFFLIVFPQYNKITLISSCIFHPAQNSCELHCTFVFSNCPFYSIP